jgi:hypothetical protein
MTVGNRDQNRWEIVEKAREQFGEAKVRWTLLQEEKILRIDGAREQENPSRVATVLPRIPDCGLYFREHERHAARSSYQELAARLEDGGFPDIAYGMIDVMG